MSSVSSTTQTESPGTAMSTVVAPEQISGLPSGLDTASIISALMQVDSQPMIAIQNQLKLEQARQAAYQSVSTELSTLTTGLPDTTVPTARTIRRRLLTIPGRITRTARKTTLRMPARWPWQTPLLTVLKRLRALPTLT